MGSLLLVVWVQGRAVPAPPVPGRPPPFDPGPLSATDADGVEHTLRLPGNHAILYVDDRCPFCAEEVGRWYRTSGGAAPRGLLLVRRPAEGVAPPGIVPRAWAPRTFLDPRGEVAAALGVTAVPFLARTDTGGTVVAVSLGLTSEERIRSILDSLARPTAQGGPHD